MSIVDAYADDIERHRTTYALPGADTGVYVDEGDAPDCPGAAHVTPIEQVEVFHEGEDPYPHLDSDTHSYDFLSEQVVRVHAAHPDAQSKDFVPPAGRMLLLYGGVTDPRELDGLYVPLQWQVNYPTDLDAMRDYDPLDPKNEDDWYLGIATTLIEKYVENGDHVTAADP